MSLTDHRPTTPRKRARPCLSRSPLTVSPANRVGRPAEPPGRPLPAAVAAQRRRPDDRARAAGDADGDVRLPLRRSDPHRHEVHRLRRPGRPARLRRLRRRDDRRQRRPGHRQRDHRPSAVDGRARRIADRRPRRSQRGPQPRLGGAGRRGRLRARLSLRRRTAAAGWRRSGSSPCSCSPSRGWPPRSGSSSARPRPPRGSPSW